MVDTGDLEIGHHSTQPGQQDLTVDVGKGEKSSGGKRTGPVHGWVSTQQDEVVSQQDATGLSSQQFDSARPSLFKPQAKPGPLPPTGKTAAAMSLDDFFNSDGFKKTFGDLTSSIDPQLLADLQDWMGGSPGNINTQKAKDFQAFLSVVCGVLAACRDLIQQLSESAAKMSAKQSALQYQTSQDIIKKLADALQQMQAAQAAAADAKKWGLVGMIASVVIGAILTVATMGTGAGLAAMMIAAAVTAGSAAITIYDYESGGAITSGMQSAITDLADDLEPVFGKLGAKIVAGLIVVAIIAVLTVALRSGAGGKLFAGTVGKMVTEEAAQNAVKAVLVSAFMQYAMQFVADSDLFGALLVEAPAAGLKAAGVKVDDNAVKMASMIINVICTAVCAIGMLYAFKGAFEGVGERLSKLQKGMQALAQIGGTTVQATVNIMQAKISFTQAEIATNQGDIQAAIQYLQQGLLKLCGVTQQDLQAVSQSFLDAAQGINHTLDSVIGTETGMLNDLFGG